MIRKLLFYIPIFTIFNISITSANIFFSDTLNIFGGGTYYNSDNSVDFQGRIDNRLISSINVKPWENNTKIVFESHLITSYSINKASNIDLPTNLVLRDDKSNLFNLTSNKSLHSDKEYQGNFYNRFDRLYISIFNSNFEFTAGRMALTWSRGRMFHVSDFFNPQIPGFYDGDYKMGTDMLYWNYSVNPNSNISLVFNPRRNYQTEELTFQDSTIAVRYFTSNFFSDCSLSFARYLNDYILSAGTSRDFFYDSIIRLDMSFLFYDLNYAKGEINNTTMLGIEKSMYIFNYITTVYLEYYYNSLGVKNIGDPLGDTMLKRLENQDTYLLGQNYLSLGLNIDLTPYTNLNYSTVVSLIDYSNVNLLSLTYSYSQSLDLGVSYTQALGEDGDEFGSSCADNNNCDQSIGSNIMLNATYHF